MDDERIEWPEPREDPPEEPSHPSLEEWAEIWKERRGADAQADPES